VGLAAAERVGPDGRVIIGDFAESMIDVARRYAAEMGVENAEGRVLDAEQLDLDDGAVDAVLCRWGYMLMPDPAAALTETHRVLRPGGRLCCSVFAGAEENPWAALPMRVLLELDLVQPPEPGSPGILALADHDRLRRLLAEAGFVDTRLTNVPFSFRLEDVDDYWSFLREAAGAIAVVLERLGDADRTAARARLEEVIEPYSTDDAILLPAAAVVASASRPS
jgi:SAM-dependent methyltransferase